MKINKILFITTIILSSILLLNQSNSAQVRVEEYSGSLFSFNGPTVRTAFFTLRINELTSDVDTEAFREILQTYGQDKLLSAISKVDAGSFSVGNGLARTINVVRQSEADGKKRIFVVFERWLQFAEVRGGYRSLDYPFGVIELLIDAATGKGEGTYIAMAQIRWKFDKKSDQFQVEIENFATYPAKLTNVEGKIIGGNK